MQSIIQNWASVGDSERPSGTATLLRRIGAGISLLGADMRSLLLFRRVFRQRVRVMSATGV
jgi:hypothetical protein